MRQIVQKNATMSETGKIEVQMPYSLDNIAAIKTIKGSYFVTATKRWILPIAEENIKKLLHWGYNVDDELLKYAEPIQIPPIPVIPGLGGKLFDYQKQGVEFINSRNGKTLLGDEMGLGKTIQALAYVQFRQMDRPVLIICPATMKGTWEKETKYWTKEKNVEVLDGTTPYSITGDIIIMNYDIVHAWKTKLEGYKPKIIILDECHYIKNETTKRAKTVIHLAKKAPKVIALSGTPFLNRPIEMFTTLNILDPVRFPSKWKYGIQYCNGFRGTYAWDFSGTSNIEELHNKLTESIMIRRKKQDVLLELPDKVHTTINVTLPKEAREDYTRAKTDFLFWLSETHGRDAKIRASKAEIITKMTALRKITALGILPSAIEWIENFMDNNPNEKLVVFAIHKEIIKTLKQHFKETSVSLNGETPSGEREKVVKDFQTKKEIQIFIGNITAAGVGITLTAASNVVFLELPWSPGVLNQATDRCHRIGQKNTVNIYYLIAKATIMETMAQLLDSKRNTFDKIIDGKETEQASLITALIDKL